MSNAINPRSAFVIPGSPGRRRKILKWAFAALIVLLGAAAFNHNWVRFQLHVVLMKVGGSETRARSLRWFIQNNPDKARHVFFEVMLEAPELRPLAVSGLLKSDQHQLMPVYLSLWRDTTTDSELRDAILELIADHAGEKGFFLFTDPDMVLSTESRYWGLAYDYLNGNASPEMIDFLISRYHAGDAQSRRAVVTAFSYLTDSAALAGHTGLRSLLADAMQSPDTEIRFRAIQAFGPVARTGDIPALLLFLDDDDRSITDAVGRLLRNLGSHRSASDTDKLPGFKELALEASRVQAKGHPHEVTGQLGLEALGRLRDLVFCGMLDQADKLAHELASRTRQILPDIVTAGIVASWNRYEFSTIPSWQQNSSTLNRSFGVTVSPEAGKLNYGQIVAAGIGRVIYCADVQAWKRDYSTERAKLLQHRDLAEKAGLEQVIRLEVTEEMLGKGSAFSSIFTDILTATRSGKGARTKFFEIGLKPGTNPAKVEEEFAELFKEAAITAKTLDNSVKLFLGPVALGDRRWYKSRGMIENLMFHSFKDNTLFRNFVNGISISTDLPLPALETELAEFAKSLARTTPRGILLWCTGFRQPCKERRSTAARLERDFAQSMRNASELPACISVLAAAGVSAVFFDPLKDTPSGDDPRTVTLNGLLYRDCMPKPVYHTASQVVRALSDSRLAGAKRYESGPGTRAVLFPGGPRPVIIAWGDGANASAQIEVGTPLACITRATPDALGNFRSTLVEATDGRITAALAREAVIVEQLDEKPAACAAAGPPGDLDVLRKLEHLPQRTATCQKSYGTYDRSGANDDGFSGTSSYLYRKDNGEYVIFDARGPGCLTRLWLGRTDDISRIRFYFDSLEKPGIDMTPKEIFDGKKAPFKYPLVAAGESAGGGSVLHLPIWFSKRLVIASVGAPRFCQADYSLLDPSVKVENSTAQNLKAKSEEIEALAAYFRREAHAIHTDCSPYVFNKEVELPPGKKVDVTRLTGPAVIRCLTVECANPADIERVILQIHWDGSDVAGVGSPLCDIFGQKYGIHHWQGHPVGYMGGKGYIHYPMPFEKSARVVLANSGSTAAKVLLSIAVKPLALGEPVERYFCCHWKTAIAGAGQEVRLLSVGGAGQFAGCVLSVYSRSDLSYLDSDILILADDACRPVVHSTGIDDYFAGGNFYERGTFSLPFCGLLTKSKATTVQYRFNIADSITFEKSFAFRIEQLPPGTRQTVISGAFFWYSKSPGGGDQP